MPGASSLLRHTSLSLPPGIPLSNPRSGSGRPPPPPLACVGGAPDPRGLLCLPHSLSHHASPPPLGARTALDLGGSGAISAAGLGVAVGAAPAGSVASSTFGAGWALHTLTPLLQWPVIDICDPRSPLHHPLLCVARAPPLPRRLPGSRHRDLFFARLHIF
jgi:hypothetical protein